HDFIYDRIYRFEDSNKVDWEFPTGLTFQTIDLGDVCRKIRDLIDTGPTNSIVQIGGPDILSSEEIVRIYRKVGKLPKSVRATEQLNAFQKMFTLGENLCPGDRYGTVTW